MTGSPASATADAPAEVLPERILVCGLNWIGDTVMSLPALRRFRNAHSAADVTLLVKPGLAALWEMSSVPDRIMKIDGGPAGVFRTASRVREGRFDHAIVLPLSFRSALIPFLARVPARTGMPGHSRDFMLTEVVTPRRAPGRTHQAYEYMELLALDDKEIEAPVLQPDEEAVACAESLLGPEGDVWAGFLPGAARGPSKRWPVEHFIELGRALSSKDGMRIAVMGARGEEDLCEHVVRGVGSGAINLAGRTSLAVWAAALGLCSVVICNDSGGMHLAAAMKTPVVALFGMTDPARTGPLGPARILQHAVHRAREVPRDSEAARLSLASITPQEVYEAVCERMGRTPQ